MPRCLIITTLAHEFAAEIERLGGADIPLTACTSVGEALQAYDGEKILFGNPDMIAKILPQLPAVDWVQSSWAGVTPLLEIGERGYVLTGIKDVFGAQIAEYVVGYLLAHELKIIERMDAQRRREWLQVPSGILCGKRLGILGTGSIGRAIAEAGGKFGVSSSGLSRSGKNVREFAQVLPADYIDKFLPNVDYLVSTLPDTPETTHLLNDATLALLPNDAYFINVGRSNVVDDKALIDALSGGRLAGATLDVFDEEPVPENSALWSAPNLLITAHIAALSHPYLIVPIFLRNYRRFTSGQSLEYVIDFDLGY